jgi:hypothetical protein
LVNFWCVILHSSSRHSAINIEASHVCGWTASSTPSYCITLFWWWVTGFYQGRARYFAAENRPYVMTQRRSCLWNICTEVYTLTGRAIAQAVRRRLPTAAVRVWSCGILWWTKVALVQVFTENFGFPCQSTFHLLLHNHLHYHPRLAQ